jgi:hypothetical protein
MSDWEQEDETSYLPLPPPALPAPHVLDQAPPEIQQLFLDILKYRVDPAGWYYDITIDKLVQQLQALNNNAVVAVGGNSDKNQGKGHMYDPYLQSFITGAGGQLSTWEKHSNEITPVVLRGVVRRKEMTACRAAGRDFYYIDTGYFGNVRKKTYHRITRNDVQNIGPIIDRPGDRLAATGVQFRKFRGGSNILIAPPSQKLLNLYDIVLQDWLESVQTEIRAHTDRPIVIRTKQGRSVRVTTDTMEMALDQDVHCLVTYSSIAAGEALLLGKPAITLGPNAAGALCSQSLNAINDPYVPTLDEVDAWARHMAYCQFTEAEMRDGTAWRILNEHA